MLANSRLSGNHNKMLSWLVCTCYEIIYPEIVGTNKEVFPIALEDRVRFLWKKVAIALVVLVIVVVTIMHIIIDMGF